MNWILHDNYLKEKDAKRQGKVIVEARLAKGAKVAPSKRTKKKSFDLFIVPLHEKGDK